MNNQIKTQNTKKEPYKKMLKILLVFLVFLIIGAVWGLAIYFFGSWGANLSLFFIIGSIVSIIFAIDPDYPKEKKSIFRFFWPVPWLILTIICIIFTVDSAYYKVKNEEIVFLGDSNLNKIQELQTGKHFITPWTKLYIFNRQKTYSWINGEITIDATTTTTDKLSFAVKLVFDINLTEASALELLKTHKADLETILKNVVRLKIKNSLAKLSKTLSLKAFDDQKKLIEAEIKEIINTELNSSGFSNHNIIFLKLGKLKKTSNNVISIKNKD